MPFIDEGSCVLKFANGDEEIRRRLANKARRRGKNGWTIGRELQVAVNRSASEPAGEKRGPLTHQHLRRRHFRMQRHGPGWKESRMIFIPPTAIRPDLPLPENYKKRYRVGSDDKTAVSLNNGK